MKKYLPKILISIFVIGIFLVPVSFSLKTNKLITKNFARALNLKEYLNKDSYIKIDSVTSNSVVFSAGVVITDETRFKTQKEIDDTGRVHIYDAYLLIKGAIENTTKEGLFICYKEKNSTEDPSCLSWMDLAIPFQLDKTDNQINQLKTGTDKFKLKPETTYILSLKILEGDGLKQSIWNWVDFTNETIIKSVEFTTTKLQSGDEQNNFTDSSNSYSNTGTDVTNDFGCGITNIGGCVAQFLNLIWQASSNIAQLGGHFLDFFIYYTTNSSSYNNEFVKEGWSTIRDISNVFFVIALIYVGIKTILNLNVTDNKKLVGTVIVIGLIINFSLFTSRVIIDGSNILAKVFYNNITSQDKDGKKVESGEGQKSISVGIIQKFNPQTIAMKIYQDKGIGYYIFIILLLIFITLYTGYTFLTVGIFFLARVASLWIAMIFSPIAFASYTLPFDIPGFGHKEWWTNLLENSFMAPIFIFFLYIIIRFTNFLDKVAVYNSDTNWVEQLLTIIVPFVIIMTLVKKSKDLAAKYAGEMGKAIMSGAKMVGGLALGATAGIAAFGGRQVLGRMMSAGANSDWAKKWEAKGWGGGMARKAMEAGGKSSFDIRSGLIGAAVTKSGLTNLNTLSSVQKGGWEKTRQDKVEKRRKRAESLKVGEDEKLKQDLNKVEEDLQDLLKENSHELEILDAKIKSAREEANDLNSKDVTDPVKVAARKAAIAAAQSLSDTDPNKATALASANAMDIEDVAKVKARKDANDKLEDLKQIKKARKNATTFIDSTGTSHDFSTNKSKNGYSISDLETNIIPHAHEKISKENRERKWKYAEQTTGWKGKANREAAHKIRMEEKIDSGNKH